MLCDSGYFEVVPAAISSTRLIAAQTPFLISLFYYQTAHFVTPPSHIQQISILSFPFPSPLFSDLLSSQPRLSHLHNKIISPAPMMLNNILTQFDCSQPAIVQHLRQILSGQDIHQAKASLRAIAGRNPHFLHLLLDIMRLNENSSIRLVTSTYLSQIMEKNIETTPQRVYLTQLAQILTDPKVELSCKLTFSRCMRAVIQAGDKCATIEEVVGFTGQLFSGTTGQKMIAMMVLESVALTDQSESSLVCYLNHLMLPLAKMLVELVCLENSDLLTRWAKASILVFDKLNLNVVSEGMSSASVDMLGYIFSSQTIASIIMKSYHLDSSEVELDELKGSMGILHQKILNFILKEDSSQTNVHFKMMETCLPFFLHLLTLSNSPEQAPPSNEEFLVSILTMMSKCATHPYFNSFFVQSSSTLVQAVLPMLKNNQCDAHNFDNQSEEFVSCLDDVCQERQSETLKCEAADILASLSQHVDGAATYIFHIAINSLKQRLHLMHTEVPSNLSLCIDESFLVLTIISCSFQKREDFRTELQHVLSSPSSLLSMLTEIQMALLYFFFSYSFHEVIGDQSYMREYILAAAEYEGHETVKYLALQFLSYQLPLSSEVSVFRALTNKLLTEDLANFEKLYSKYLKKVFKTLSEDDLLHLASTLVSRINSQLPKHKKLSHNVYLCFNILTIVTSKSHLLSIDNRLCKYLKDVVSLIQNPDCQCLESVMEVYNHILLSQQSLTQEDFVYIQSLRDIVRNKGNVELVFFTVCLFVRKMEEQTNSQILGQLFALTLEACQIDWKESGPEDVGEGLLLLQKFVGKFGRVMTEDAKRQLLQFLPTIDLKGSSILKGRLVLVYIGVYLSYSSEEFRRSIIDAILSDEKAFEGYERTSLIQGISQMLLIERDPAVIQLMIFIATRLLEAHRTELEQNKSKQKSKKKNNDSERARMEASVTKMLLHTPKLDIFSQFSKSLLALKQSNEALFSQVMKEMPEYLTLALGEIMRTKEVDSQPRTILKIRSVKRSPVVSESQKSQESGNEGGSGNGFGSSRRGPKRRRQNQ